MSHAESRGTIEALQKLWSPHVSQTLRRAIGGFDRVQQAEVLFSFVRQYQEGVDQARLLVAGQEASEEFLRGLRIWAGASSPSHRSRYNEQRPNEHPDAMQALSRLLAHGSEAQWSEGGWENGIPRVASGVTKRVDRLRALGNAVVPQIPEIIGRAIMQAEGVA